MKQPTIRRAIVVVTMFFVLGLGYASTRVAAQIPEEPGPTGPRPGNQEPNWKDQLGLTDEQMGRIRAIREQNRLDGQAARRRVNQAQRALDQAIYSDTVNETEIDQRVRELATAQAAEVRLRALTELNIRRVLTAQQLNTFRIIRLQRMRDAQMQRRMENGEQPGPRNQRMENGGNRPMKRDGEPRRPADLRQGNGNVNPVMIPRRGNLPRRIRP
jgi:Spy/CpxP family protein refolding chaperone